MSRPDPLESGRFLRERRIARIPKLIADGKETSVDNCAVPRISIDFDSETPLTKGRRDEIVKSDRSPKDTNKSP